jgi:hypothetical protein
MKKAIISIAFGVIAFFVGWLLIRVVFPCIGDCTLLNNMIYGIELGIACMVGLYVGLSLIEKR